MRRELHEKWAQNLRQEHDLLAKTKASHVGLAANFGAEADAETFLETIAGLLDMPEFRAQRSTFFDDNSATRTAAQQDE